MHFSIEKTASAKNAYNVKTNAAYNWLKTIPWRHFGIDASDGINKPEIINLQEAVGADADGLVGLTTLRRVQNYLRHDCQLLWNPYNGLTTHLQQDDVNVVLWKGLEVPLPEFQSARVYTYLDPHGINLHSTGSFTKKARDIEAVIVHWGGLNPQHLGRVFENRKASSHFGVGICEVTGEASVFQYIDAAHIAWHAKGANTTTLGVDICQQPELKHLGYYKRNSYYVDTISNPSAPKYGPSKIISLDPRIVRATIDFLKAIQLGFEIENHVPLTSEGLIGDSFQGRKGVFSHFHVDFKGQGKWDVAPWWDEIANGLTESDFNC